MLSRSFFSHSGLDSGVFGFKAARANPSPTRMWTRSPETGRLSSMAVAQAAPQTPREPGSSEEASDTISLSPRPVSAALPAQSLRLMRPYRTLMSYNAQDFYQTPKNRQIKSQAAIRALAEVIEKENPDVVALQEVGDKGILNQFNIRHLKGQYPNIVSNPVWAKSQHQLAFLSKGNIKVVETKSHWKEFCKLSQGAAVRDLLEATFETETGYRFTVFNSHLKSMRGGEGKTAPVRWKEANAAAQIIQRHLQDRPEAHVFITGDLNTHYDSNEGKPVIEALERLGQPDGEPLFTEVTLKDNAQKPTNRAFGYPDSKLDYTFSSKALTPLIKAAYVAGNFEEAPWREASDHLPLVTLFEEGTPQTPPKSARSDAPARSGDKPQHGKHNKKRKLELIA
ncbi:endonuclease/exonuclease/phosphatase family protein [Vampirovibrio sp.]|uniref:endonuclease/exonuclease/phosphatase family protein n=1 Tax=Vampirovibrio sp. TaxID=2717857 RepID=UPI003593EFA0